MMKANLKLNSNLSVKVLEAKARKAAAIATVTSAVERKMPKTKAKTVPLIDREIRSVFRDLSTKSPEHEVIKIEYLTDASCKAIIKVFARADFNRQLEEEHLHRELLSQGRRSDDLPKPYKATPVVVYALYPTPYDSEKLGSVAIYGRDLRERRSLFLKLGSFYGHAVASANIEVGRRLFLDVKFRR